jgi:hypothetical protein
LALAIGSQMPTNTGVSGTAQTSPWTWSFTNTAGTVLYVFVEWSGSPTAITVTYGGASMTSLSTRAANNNTSGLVGLYRKLTPLTGANNVVVTWTGGAMDVTAGAISFTGNDTVTPEGTPVTGSDTGGTASTWSVSVTSTTSGNIVLASAVYGDPANSAITGGSLAFRKELNGSAFTNNQTCQTVSSAGGTVTPAWTNTTATSWAAIAVEVKAASAGGTTAHLLSSIGVGK